ncbi:relaxin receptor 2-like [Haliotis cracherodii]|uniref:relaxin receptor 2-like n=1 Tax=Haliotis cracherodii TaxID=6455 RepID=UPI0039EBC7FE
MKLGARCCLLMLGIVENLYSIDARKSWQDIVCPRGQFRCGSGECLDNALQNDKKKDCKDGSDETMEDDKGQGDYWNTIYSKRPTANDDKLTDACGLNKVPEGCQCRNKTILKCGNAHLSSVPSGLSKDVKVLDLSGNRIEVVSHSDFKDMQHLEELIFSHCYLEEIQRKAFNTCSKLRKIYLTDNLLGDLPQDMFPENNNVEELYLSHNRLTILKPEYFDRLTKLKHLKLDNNLIRDIVPMTFAKTGNLQSLLLDGNNLDKIEHNYFADLGKLQTLIISRNRIASIESSSFRTLKSLKHLVLFGNFISSLRLNTLLGLTNLTQLNLRDNSLNYIIKGVFDPLQNISSIDLRDNHFHGVQPGTFDDLSTLKYIYFDRFHLCVYVKNIDVCEPRGDGISSRENLLENIILRVTVWIVAILACFGNCAVLMGRFILKEDNQIHSFFIKNLSMADLLMGIYLTVIAVHDMRYRGRYLSFDHTWRDSWGCDVCGLLSTVSSEVSVLTLTVITLDRYLCIMYPLSERRRHLRLAYVLMGSIWLFSLALATIPIVGLNYFGTYFYRNNAVCIPLLLHEPRNSGWEYSAFIFLGINMVSFVFIAYAYVAMFVSIRKSRMLFRSTNENQERSLMKRFFFIVITDFACWVPIIALKVAALMGFKIPGYLYGWVVVFILPVNCALNPLLYTLTCTMFKQKFLYSLSNLMWRKSMFDSNSSDSSTSKSRLSRRSMPDIELDQCALNNTWTGKMKYKYSHGRVVYPNWSGQQYTPSGYRPVKLAI